jgi:hypothetical protein
MRQSDLVRQPRKAKVMRTTQIIFGERQHLLRVLDSLERTRISTSRLEAERRVLEELIHARTMELNAINSTWDQKVATALSSDARPEFLDQLARQAPKEDFYLLRLISEHPRTSARTLARLAAHKYSAIRENVARHPNTDPATLLRLSRDRSQPLWYLVAFNPNTSASLRSQLQARMRKLGQAPQSR